MLFLSPNQVAPHQHDGVGIAWSNEHVQANLSYLSQAVSKHHDFNLAWIGTSIIPTGGAMIISRVSRSATDLPTPSADDHFMDVPNLHPTPSADDYFVGVPNLPASPDYSYR